METPDGFDSIPNRLARDPAGIGPGVRSECREAQEAFRPAGGMLGQYPNAEFGRRSKVPGDPTGESFAGL
jgi:hypothetical protein